MARHLKRGAANAGYGGATSTSAAVQHYSTAAAPCVSYNWKRIKGFLFDIDGTLCDTDPLHLVAFRDCLKKAGIKQEVDETFFKANISGRSNPDIARYVPSHLNERPFSFEAFRKRKYSDRRIIIIIIFSGFQRDLLPHLSEEEKEQWIVDKEEYFCNLARKEIRPVEGLVELVSWIKQNDIRLAAVTNAPRANAEMILEGLGMTSKVDVLVIANETPANKPSPIPYITAMQKLDLEPADCCVVEDSIPGATAGVAAKVHTIGILTSQTEEAMKAVGVKQTIRNYNELLDEIVKATTTTTTTK